MYILIENDRMVLLHKHTDFRIVADLAWIECRDCSCAIFKVDDAHGLKEYTDLELRTLYQNITGQDIKLQRRQLQQVLVDLIARIPETKVRELEVQQQVERIPEDDTGKWLYVYGAKRPAQKPDLFEHACCRAKPSEEEINSAKAGKLPALKVPKRAAAPRTRDDRPEAGVTLRPPAPKRGTAKPIIWATADRMWEEAGKPTDKAQVLALRKEIMNVLEKEEAIRRTSSSSELGNWHKERAPF